MCQCLVHHRKIYKQKRGHRKGGSFFGVFEGFSKHREVDEKKKVGSHIYEDVGANPKIG
jgi:hypothetical protein